MASEMDVSTRTGFGRFWKSWPVIAVTILVATVVVLMVSPVVQSAYEQHLANEYPTVEGTILESKTQRFTQGARNTRYAAIINYSYDIAGESFTGSRVRASGPVTFLQWEEARAHAAQFPKNSSVTVYYDPERPERSVLEPGFGVPEMRRLNAMRGFLSLPLLAWLVAVAMIRWEGGNTTTGGVRIVREPGRVSAQLTDFKTWLITGIAACIANFLTSFFSLPFNTLNATLVAEGAGWVCMGILTLMAYRWAKDLRDNPKHRLIINTQDGTLDLPTFGPRKDSQCVRIEDIGHISVGPTSRRMRCLPAEWRKTMLTRNDKSQLILLHPRAADSPEGDAEQAPMPAARLFKSPNAANQFAAWFSQESGLPLEYSN